MRSITNRRRVPLAWRQLAAEPMKLAVSVVAVAAAVALVLVLAGLRRGISEQVSLYVDRQAPILVGQRGTRDFVGATSVLPDSLGPRLARIPGVESVAPISEQYAMLRLHGKRVLSLLVGYDPGGAGGPWDLAEGRGPRASGEVVLDRVLASEHGLGVGSTLSYRGEDLRVVGLSNGTTGFMSPLAFATRETVNALSQRPETATFFLVQPDAGVPVGALVERIERALPTVSALERGQLAANDRALFSSSLKGPLFAMVAIAVAVAILVIAMTVYSSTSERASEYATLKAIGLRGRALLRLVGVQAVGLALAGTAIGTLLAFGGKWAVSELAPKYLVAISPGSVLLMALGALAMALAAGLVPARYIAHLDPASAFRK